ncbi:hypothetical protein JW851_00300 [Candidatus Woesearchaeota archaeon]|nr:hypothetical protein [Candidatus Woesearchaeota archaeon]
MKQMKKEKKSIKQIIQRTFTEFLASFKDKNIIWVFSYDICFLLTAGILAKAASKLMSTQLARLGLTNVQSLTPEIISQQLGAIKTLAITFFIIIIIFYLLLILDYALFRAWIWTKLLNQKPTKAFVKRFFILNLIWATGWVTLFGIGATILTPEYYVYMLGIGTILYIHLTTVLHHSFAWKQEIKRAIGKAFTTGIGHTGLFFIPYIYIIIIYIILTKAFTLIPEQIQYPAIFLIIIIFMAWYRVYMNQVIKNIEKRGI